MRTLDEIWQRLDEISAELNELHRELILRSAADDAVRKTDEQAYAELRKLAKEISKSWTGPDAMDEIRAQREK